jgi:hypothetical protein
MLFRRFGFLQTRLLLEKQDDLRQLELELERLDKREAKKPGETTSDRLKARRYRSNERKELNLRIEKAWLDYSKLPDFLLRFGPPSPPNMPSRLCDKRLITSQYSQIGLRRQRSRSLEQAHDLRIQ